VDLRRGLSRSRRRGRERGWRVLSGTAEAGGLCPDKYMAWRDGRYTGDLRRLGVLESFGRSHGANDPSTDMRRTLW